MTTQTVRVMYGSNNGHFPVAGTTIQQVRKGLSDAFSIPKNVIAEVNGCEQPHNYVLVADDYLEFSKRVGQKGGLPDFVTENEIRQWYGDKGFKRLTDAGLKPSTQTVFSGFEVAAYGQTLATNEQCSPPIPLSVDIEGETITFKGKSHDCERTVALVLKCLLDARGEIRSTGDIKKAFPDEAWEERLYDTIKRKLIPHKSGIGEHIKPVGKRGYRLLYHLGR